MKCQKIHLAKGAAVCGLGSEAKKRKVASVGHSSASLGNDLLIKCSGINRMWRENNSYKVLWKYNWIVFS